MTTGSYSDKRMQLVLRLTGTHVKFVEIMEFHFIRATDNCVFKISSVRPNQSTLQLTVCDRESYDVENDKLPCDYYIYIAALYMHKTRSLQLLITHCICPVSTLSHPTNKAFNSLLFIFNNYYPLRQFITLTTKIINKRPVSFRHVNDSRDAIFTYIRICVLMYSLRAWSIEVRSCCRT